MQQPWHGCFYQRTVSAATRNDSGLYDATRFACLSIICVHIGFLRCRGTVQHKGFRMPYGYRHFLRSCVSVAFSSGEGGMNDLLIQFQRSISVLYRDGRAPLLVLPPARWLPDRRRVPLRCLAGASENPKTLKSCLALARHSDGRQQAPAAILWSS